MSPNPDLDAATRLCLDCGLCCSGALFDVVKLQPGDNAKALTARGLKIKQGQWFNQPCAALAGRLCGLYRDRPSRCRLFECRQYQGVAAGELDALEALDRIRQAQRQISDIEQLLTSTQGNNLRKPLAQRYATALAGASQSDTPLPPALVPAMERLQAWLDEHFRHPRVRTSLLDES